MMSLNHICNILFHIFLCIISVNKFDDLTVLFDYSESLE